MIKQLYRSKLRRPPKKECNEEVVVLLEEKC